MLNRLIAAYFVELRVSRKEGRTNANRTKRVRRFYQN
jgi:hypothetical protein